MAAIVPTLKSNWNNLGGFLKVDIDTSFPKQRINSVGICGVFLELYI